MSVILIEGPEKAGKSTLATALAKVLAPMTDRVEVRHMVGRAKPDDRVYSRQLAEDTAAGSSDLIAVWDRCWPSEYVYGTLLHQDRRLAGDPWLGEWLYGRAVNANGLRVILPGPDSVTLAASRDNSDLPVDPGEEQRLYLAYAFRFGWLVLERENIDDMTTRVVREYFTRQPLLTPIPPTYVGFPDADVIIVGEERAGAMTASILTTTIGRLLGDRALNIGWANAHDCPPDTLRYSRIIVACGKKAKLWVDNYVVREGGSQRVIAVPHPSHAFRYNNETAR